MDKIRISIQDPEAPVTVVRVDGIVDTVTAGEVDRALGGLLEREKFRIALDLAGVDYISSAGWGVFIAHLKRAREHAGDVRLSGMIPNVREIFELLEFDTILRDYPSADQAARSFQQGERPLEGGPRGPSAHSGGTLEELSAIGVDQPLSMIAGHMESRGESRSIDPLRRLAEQVAEDPFASIGELRDLLNDGGGGAPVGWWWTFRSLVNLGLLSRRARFRFARRRSKAGPV